jgi:hypothetical protein
VPAPYERGRQKRIQSRLPEPPAIVQCKGCCSRVLTASSLMFAFRLVLERLLGGADSTGAASAIASNRNASASDALARDRPARDVSAGTAVIGDDRQRLLPG